MVCIRYASGYCSVRYRVQNCYLAGCCGFAPTLAPRTCEGGAPKGRGESIVGPYTPPVKNQRFLPAPSQARGPRALPRRCSKLQFNRLPHRADNRKWVKSSKSYHSTHTVLLQANILQFSLIFAQKRRHCQSGGNDGVIFAVIGFFCRPEWPPPACRRGSAGSAGRRGHPATADPEKSDLPPIWEVRPEIPG